MNLKELRMWHWKECLAAKSSYTAIEAYPVTQKSSFAASVYRKQYAFHMKAVQALNDVLPGTAEGDIAHEVERERLIQLIQDLPTARIDRERFLYGEFAKAIDPDATGGAE